MPFQELLLKRWQVVYGGLSRRQAGLNEHHSLPRDVMGTAIIAVSALDALDEVQSSRLFATT